MAPLSHSLLNTDLHFCAVPALFHKTVPWYLGWTTCTRHTHRCRTTQTPHRQMEHLRPPVSNTGNVLARVRQP